MITAREITYVAGGRELLSDVSVDFPPGKLHLIVGPNGAGKSTLIKVLARLIRPQKGVVRYDECDVASAREADLARRRAVLSQAVEVAFPLDVREVVMMGRYPHFGGRPGSIDEKIVDEMMELFDVTDFAARNYQTLSGGERQRVNFARVLGQLWQGNEDRSSSRCLFLDEPLTFLDIRHQIDFMKKVKDFAADRSTVTIGVVHDLNLAARFADQIVLLDEGRAVASGLPAHVLTESQINEVFGIRPLIISDEGVGINITFN